MTRYTGLRFLVLFLALTDHMLPHSSAVLAIQPVDESAPATSDEEPPKPDESDDPLPGLRQLGDDASPELTDPVRTPDEKRREALAAYMEGVAAQKNGQLNKALDAYRRASEADPNAAEPVRARALLLMRLGRQLQAVQEARKAIELDPDDYETRIQLAVLILNSRQNPAAAAALIEEALQSKKLAKDSKEFISIHQVRGRLYIQAQDAPRASESYHVILDALEEPEKFGLDFREHQKLMSDRATGYETVGRVMLQVGQYDSAARAFQALVRVNEDRPGDYHYLLALVQFRKDDLEECEKNLNLYFESNRRSREALQLLSDLYTATSRSDQMLDRLSDLAMDTTDAGTVKLFRGFYLLDKGEADEAAVVFRSVIEDTGDAEGYIGLIRTAIAKRDTDQLLENVHKALRARIQIQELIPLQRLIVNDPDFGKQAVAACIESLEDKSYEQHPLATYFFSQLAHSDQLDLPKEEGVLLEATLEQNPGGALGIQARSRLGLNQYMRDQYVEAAKTFRLLLAMPGLPPGDRIMTLYRLSAAEAENENYDEAIAAVRKALVDVPDNPQLMYQLGLIQLQAERFEESEKTLKATVQAAEGDAERQGQAQMLLGGLYTQLGRWDDAIQIYRALLETPDIPPAVARRGRMALSNAYVQGGDIENGEKVLELVYAATPNDPGVNNDLGYLYADQNKKLDQAESMIRLAVEAEPDNPAYLDSLGWVLYRLGRYDEALEVLKKANSDPNYRDSTIIEHLGDVQQALKQDDAARKTWQEALEVEKKSTSPSPESIDRLNGKLNPDGSAESGS